MNFGELDVQRVQHNRPQMQRILTDEVPTTPVNVRYDNVLRDSYTSTASEAATVIPWHSPPPPLQAPTPLERYTQPHSPPYTPDEKASLAHTPQQIQHLEHNLSKAPGGTNEESYTNKTPQVVRFDEEQIRSDENMASNKERRDQMEMESDTPTPNTEEYTRYIQFALQQLTAHEEFNSQRRPNTAVSMQSEVDRMIPPLPVEQQDSLTRQEKALVRKHRSSPVHKVASQGILYTHNPTPKLSPTTTAPPILPRRHNNTSLSAIPTPRDFPLTFKPKILRLPSMMILCFLCLLMIAAIVFCAVYSPHHQGLTQWAGGLDGGWYFVFAFLPQILAASLLVYVQCVMAAVTRTIPFTIMATGNEKARENALFLGIYPLSLMYPRWVGHLGVDVAMTLLWLTIFTIPLQSCLFSVIPVAGGWRWTAVTGVAWTLVAIYFLIWIGAAAIAAFFFRKPTGLRWDACSVADLITMLPQSSKLGDFDRTDQVGSKREIKRLLTGSNYRLGWWTTENYEEKIYGIGEEDASRPNYQRARPPYITATLISQQINNLRNIRSRYISWQLRDTFVIFWIVTAFVLLIALIVISFLPSTAIRNGFPPLVKVAPDAGGFSASNFLYSFIPSVLGMLLYILFQPLDMALRKLQPWAELGPEGATAENSLLLDYTAALPIACTVNALAARHYRFAFTSFLSIMFIVLPILAGGLFFPLTISSGEVRMLPNLPSFYVILAILILYLIGLLVILPNRKGLQLPHDVNCLAEIFSFFYNSPIIADAEFSGVRSKSDLVRRLVSKNSDATNTRYTEIEKGKRETRYTFGVFKGRNQELTFGVDRVVRQGRGSELVTFEV